MSQLAQRLLDRLAALGRSDQLVLGVLAVIVGAAAAYGAIAFREIADLTALMAWGQGEEQIPDAARGASSWRVLLVPCLGGLLIGVLCQWVLPGPQPRGVADVIEANALNNGRMPWRLGWSAALVSAGSIGFGASVGREGPIVHLGATLASVVARRLHLSPSLSRTLLGCGVAAAIAAAFNAPIAGVFFALEVVVGHYGLGAFSPVVIASLIGTIVTRVHIGNEPAFGLPGQTVASMWEVPAFLLLGIVCAGAAIVLMRGIGLVQTLHERLKIPMWLRPAIGGFLLGVLAIRYPEILGVGYEVTTAALNTKLAFGALISLGIAKLLATMLCLGSRFGGAIFSPSLAVGALVGGAYGIVATSLFPALGSSYAVYAILGMGAVAASTLGAPISTVIMIFELTSNYGVTFALMACVAVATVVTRQVFGESYFHWQLEQRGVSIDGHRELGLLRTRRVAQVMREDHIEVQDDCPLDELKRRFRSTHAPIFVIDSDKRLIGAISFEDLADAAFRDDADGSTTARSLARKLPVMLLPDDDLARALGRCQTHQEEHIPVVRSRESLEVLGEVRYADLIQAYNSALLEARAIEQGRR